MINENFYRPEKAEFYYKLALYSRKILRALAANSKAKNEENSKIWPMRV